MDKIHERAIARKRLAYCLKIFLEAAEAEFCVPLARWPLRRARSPRWGEAAVEYRTERARRERGRGAA
jgi:hypothetical protein